MLVTARLNMNLPLGIGVAAGFFFGILFHEYATAKVADRLGDTTSRLMRRISLSIKSHVDPLGTLILPAVFTLAALFNNTYIPLFGWGKRHSLNPRGLRNPRRDILVVSLTGPLVTFALAAVAGVVYRATRGELSSLVSLVEPPPLARVAAGIVLVGVFLTVIELLPLPGRDGGRVLQRFLSPAAAMKMEELAQYDMLFLLGIFLLGRLFTGTLLGMADPVCSMLTGFECAVLTL